MIVGEAPAEPFQVGVDLQMCMCMCACARTLVCTHVRARMCVHACTCACRPSMYMCVHACTCACRPSMYMCLPPLLILTHAHVHMHMCMLHVHAHVHVTCACHPSLSVGCRPIRTCLLIPTYRLACLLAHPACTCTCAYLLAHQLMAPLLILRMQPHLLQVVLSLILEGVGRRGGCRCSNRPACVSK